MRRLLTVLVFSAPILALAVSSCDESESPTEPESVQTREAAERATPSFDKVGVKPSKSVTGIVGTEIVRDGPRHGTIGAAGFPSCPEGKIAINGGYEIDASPSEGKWQDFRVIRNRPNLREWQVEVVNLTNPPVGTGFDLEVWALCVEAEIAQ